MLSSIVIILKVVTLNHLLQFGNVNSSMIILFAGQNEYSIKDALSNKMRIHTLNLKKKKKT